MTRNPKIKTTGRIRAQVMARNTYLAMVSLIFFRRSKADGVNGSLCEISNLWPGFKQRPPSLHRLSNAATAEFTPLQGNDSVPSPFDTSWVEAQIFT